MSPHRQRRAPGAPYDRVADFYDFLADFYSAGGIARSKLAHLDDFEPGQSLLYAGAGTGAECVAAARLGMKVTALDLSQTMLSRCETRARQADVDLQILQMDVREARGSYDAVIAPFFLNVFSPTGVDLMLRSLAERVAPGGQLLTVDFSAPSSSPLRRFFQNLYYLAPLFFFWATTRNAWHGVYDYAEMAQLSLPEFRLERRTVTPAWGLPLFETISWRRPE